MELNVWIGVQFLLDLSLLFIILYLFYKSRKWGGPLFDGDGQSVVNMNTEINQLIETLKMHVEEAESTSDRVSKELDEKMKQIQLLNEETEHLYSKVDEKSKDKGSQKYVEAIKLVKEGKEADEICRELGLLRGEVDLIIALNKVDDS